MAPRVALCLLGPLHIERDGVPLKLNRRRALALPTHLALTGQRHYRTSLVTLFSPEYHGRPFRGRPALADTEPAGRENVRQLMRLRACWPGVRASGGGTFAVA